MKEFKSFYKEVKGNEGDKCKYPTRLDTYGCGCQHDCSYCYAKSLLEFKYTLKQSGYRHLPLEEKKRILAKINIPNLSVCEDVTEHYDYWRDNFNPNKQDCCNLKIGEL